MPRVLRTLAAMQRHHHHAASLAVAADGVIQPTLGIGIKPGARLIQQPQRRPRHQQPGERQPPLLSGR